MEKPDSEFTHLKFRSLSTRRSHETKPHIIQRRESFLYRNDAEVEISPRNSTFNSFSDNTTHFGHTEDAPIVTPFAQILASLRRVHSSFMTLTKQSSSFSKSDLNRPVNRDSIESGDDQPDPMAEETLKELEWCLDQLENIQTHRSVSDMATNKFKKMLNKELSQFGNNSKSGNQITQYITSTFLTDDVDNCVETLEDSCDNSLQRIRKSSINESKQTLEYDHSEEGANSAKVSRCTSSNVGRPSSTGRHPAHHSTPGGVSAVGGHPTGTQNTAHIAAANPVLGSASPAVPSPSTAGSGGYRGPVFDLVEEEEVAEDSPISQYPQELNRMLDDELDSWGIDVFRIHSLSNKRPLTAVAFSIIEKRGLCNKFEIEHGTLHRYLIKLEEHYHDDVPYHNSIHAADVVQSTHVLISANALEDVFTDLEIFAALFASAVHDVNHPGVTNQYLINTNDPLAVLYNDSSVLENHHLAVAFSLLQEKNSDIFHNLSKKQRQIIRKMTIDIVLATDMSKHMSLLADLKTMVETKKVSGSGVLNLENYNEKLQILQNIVHCADLSNPSKPLAIYQEWIHRIMEEFFRQGDKERANNLDISPMCDRESATVEKSQVSFIDFIAHPLWETWADLVYPDAQYIFDILQENRDWLTNMLSTTQSSTEVSNADPDTHSLSINDSSMADEGCEPPS